MKEVLGPVPVLAEDLGLITPEVEQLRDDHGFPGMRVLQFALDQAGDRDNIFLPHNYERNCVVYTGTHDNDTTLGWYRKCSSEDRKGVCRYLGWSSDHSDHDVAQELSRVALSSVAALVVLPMQDVLGLDSWARMNTPAVSAGNWQWRMVPNYDDHGASTQLADWVDLYQRRPASATT